MTSRRLSAFIGALVAGRRPKPFRADLEDAEMLRAAIALRAARPGEAAPSSAFVSGLFQQLSDQLSPHSVPATRAEAPHRARTTLVAVAAASVLIMGTAVATESFQHARSGTTAQAPDEAAVRTGTFQAARSSSRSDRCLPGPSLVGVHAR